MLVYYYGGGFMAGDGSEPRYDGESMAKQGIVAVTVNYRLNVFGFMAHPELTAESAHKASGGSIISSPRSTAMRACSSGRRARLPIRSTCPVAQARRCGDGVSEASVTAP